MGKRSTPVASNSQQPPAATSDAYRQLLVWGFTIRVTSNAQPRAGGSQVRSQLRWKPALRLEPAPQQAQYLEAAGGQSALPLTQSTNTI